MTRQEAHEIVRKAGGEPGNSVSRQTSMLVVGMEGWPLLPDGKISNKLRRAEQINQKYQSIQILSEVVFLELAGLQERKPELEKTYPADEVCRLLKIESQTLQHWERFSLISSQGGMYDFQDIVTLRMIENLLQQGIQCETIATSIKGLSCILPGTDRPLAQLKIVADNPKSLLADLGSVHLAPDGQLAFNFETKQRGEARVVELPSDPLTATEWLERGRILEAQENLPGSRKGLSQSRQVAAHFS